MEVSGSPTGVQMRGGCCWTSGRSVDSLHTTHSVLAAHTARPKDGQGFGPWLHEAHRKLVSSYRPWVNSGLAVSESVGGWRKCRLPGTV